MIAFVFGKKFDDEHEKTLIWNGRCEMCQRWNPFTLYARTKSWQMMESASVNSQFESDVVCVTINSQQQFFF